MGDLLTVINPVRIITSRIYFIRDQEIMLDRDLAQLYGVETTQIKRAVIRNRERFPNDFMFELSKSELSDLKCQIGTSSWGGLRYMLMDITKCDILIHEYDGQQTMDD